MAEKQPLESVNPAENYTEEELADIAREAQVPRKTEPEPDLAKVSSEKSERITYEQEWLKYENPSDMLSCLQFYKDRKFEDKKVRLYMYACKSGSPLMDHMDMSRNEKLEQKEALDWFEKIIEGEITIEELATRDDLNPSVLANIERLTASGRFERNIYDAASDESNMITLAIIKRETDLPIEGFRNEKTRQVKLLRDIFGDNPFAKEQPSINSAWINKDVINMAWNAYKGDFESLGIIADALEEAGCDNREILDHLRSLGPHVKGCWALDLILQKEESNEAEE